MKGYKAFSINRNGNFYCRDFVYNLKNENLFSGYLEVNVSGLHLFSDFMDCFNYIRQDIGKYFIAEVVTKGEIKILNNVACTNRLEIIKFLNSEEIIQLLILNGVNSKVNEIIRLAHPYNEKLITKYRNV